MSEQETLFPLPPPQPTRLEAFKTEHHIWTHDCPSDGPEWRWMAIKFDSAETVANPWEEIGSRIMAYVDSDKAAYGRTEADAVLELAQKLGLQVVL